MKFEIFPYFIQDSLWVFDDSRFGLKEEAFVCGMSEMINRVVSKKQIYKPKVGFKLSFDSKFFENYDVLLNWEKTSNELGYEGNWYYGNVFGKEMKGWLCPALFNYFKDIPKNLYVSAENLPKDVNPFWDI